MSQFVQTPLSQALAEGRLDRREIKALMRRSDGPALWRLALHISVALCTAGLVSLAMGSWLLVPAMFIHGIVLVHFFALQHECIHYTAFKTRWMNDVAGNFCAFIIMLPHRFFRYEHCDHHTYTQLVGKDTEMIELPKTMSEYLFYLSTYPYWRAKFQEISRHAGGHLTNSDKRFVPREEHATIIWEARLMLLFYTIVFAVCVVGQFTAPLWYWLVPVLLGEPVMRAIRMTEHVGRPTVSDMAVNTRSSRVSWPWQLLCWNMNYHAEHHYVSSVPFHALPQLADKLRGHIHQEPHGYIGAHLDILRQIR